MNRIYLKTSTEQFMSSDKGRYFLSYLKVRSASRKTCGFFNLERFITSTGLQRRSALIHLTTLIERGFIAKVSSDRFHVISIRTVNGHRNRDLYFSISDKELASYTHKNIASFRAFLVELECERYKRHQKAAAKGYTIRNQRDKSSEKIFNPSLCEWDQLMANSCTGKLMGISLTTASKYRRRQCHSKYNYERFGLTMSKTQIPSRGATFKQEEVKGRFFTMGNSLFFFSISKRVSSIILRNG